MIKYIVYDFGTEYLVVNAKTQEVVKSFTNHREATNYAVRLTIRSMV
jgi:hypothetical protein